MSLMGPTPWISHEMLMGPPRPWATGARPFLSGTRSQMAVGKAGCLMVSATVGTSGDALRGVMLGCLGCWVSEQVSVGVSSNDVCFSYIEMSLSVGVKMVVMFGRTVSCLVSLGSEWSRRAPPAACGPFRAEVTQGIVKYAGCSLWKVWNTSCGPE